MTNLYDVLGLEKSATDADIKKAYRKKAQQYHPDKNPGDTAAEQKFKEVQEAYEVLSDKQKRSQYDQFGSVGGNPFGGATGSYGDFQGGFGNFADIFESFFGGGGGFPGQQQSGTRKQGPTRGRDIEARLEVSFEEAVFGTVKHLELTKPETCEPCGGSAVEPGSKLEKCGECGGSGQVRQTRQTILGQISSVQACPKCLGRGEYPEVVCKTCNGETRVSKTQEVSIKIPKGIESGTTIRLQNKGAAGAYGGPHGDLFLHVTVAEHPRFQRDATTIYSAESVHALLGVLGGTIKVETVHGKAELKVPAGTQSGTTFTIRGQGAPSLRNEKLGNHEVTIHLRTPEKLSKKEKELYEELAKEAGLN